MFDARSILDAIVAGSSEETRRTRASGGLGDIMGDILKNAPRDGGGTAAPDQPTSQPSGLPRRDSGEYDQASRGDESGGDPLGDILRKLGGGDAAPGGGHGGGGLGDLLGKLARGAQPGQGGESGGDALGDIFARTRR